MTSALSAGFLESATKTPDRPALWVDGGLVSYGELRDTALRIAATLQQHVHGQAPQLTAVLAECTIDVERTGPKPAPVGVGDREMDEQC